MDPRCNETNGTIERYQLEGTSKYLIVQVPQVGEKLDKEGNTVVDDKGDKLSVKIHEKVQSPRGVVDLSALLLGDKE